MDMYLKQNDVDRAALIAHEIMLQEDEENPLTLAACLFSCLKCIKNMGGPNRDILQEPVPEPEQKVSYFIFFIF